jgi:hypothetical protein
MGPVTIEVKNGMFSFLMYKFVFFFWILENRQNVWDKQITITSIKFDQSHKMMENI